MESEAPLAPATSLLLTTDVSIEEIAVQGKAFNWKRPKCPSGCLKVWGHGYVARYFAILLAAVLLRRYRCPTCRQVFTMMPAGYSSGHQTADAAMAAAIESHLSHLGWPKGVPRQRAGHWFRKFLTLCRMDFSDEDPLAVLRRLMGDGLHFLV